MKKILLALFLLLPTSVCLGQTVAPYGGVAAVQFFDNSGVPLTSGVLYSYQAGTTTQQATYTDSTGTVQNPNPITFTAGGRTQIWLTIGNFYKFVLCTQNDGPTCAGGDILFSVDQVPGGSTSSGGGSCGSTCTSIFISSTASPATSGALRLASGDTICWRNAAGSANLCISKDANDLLSWAGGSLKLPEVGAPAGVAGFDIFWADNTAHRWKMNNNGGSADTVVGAATTDTFTNKTYNAQGSGNVFQIGGVTITSTGQSSTTFLRGDGTWVVSNEAAYGLTASSIGAGSSATCSTAGFGLGQCTATVFPGPHTILRLTYTVVTSPANCTTALVVGVRDITSSTNLTTLTVANGASIGFVDSGALSVAMTAGDTIGIGAITASSGCTTNPQLGNVTMVYR